ncbi:MAG: SOS response-associated peptidase, partial [Acidobacteria bacterium]|nr:SOS response-associated peptidase [Acidobacteriota bacterium]
MCGRYSQSKAQAILLSRFGIAVDESEPLAWPVIAPTESPGVIVKEAGGGSPGRVLRPMRWGLLSPSFHDAGAPLLINARSETVFEKPAFRTAVRTRRVLVPADGFFEWRKEGKRSQPVLFRRPQGELFALAGLAAER